MAVQNIFEDLLKTRQSLLDEYGNMQAKMQTIVLDIQRVDEMLSRYGFMPVQAGGSQANQPDVVGAPEAEPSPDEIVAGMITAKGPQDTAFEVCAWLIKTAQVANPASVKDLLEKFPD